MMALFSFAMHESGEYERARFRHALIVLLHLTLVVTTVVVLGPATDRNPGLFRLCRHRERGISRQFQLAVDTLMAGITPRILVVDDLEPARRLLGNLTWPT